MKVKNLLQSVKSQRQYPKMIFQDFKDFIENELCLETESLSCKLGDFLVIKNFRLNYGEFEGQIIDIAIKKVHNNPFTPQRAIHIKPKISKPGAIISKKGLIKIRNVIEGNRTVGNEWQYWSINFHKPIINPKEYWHKIYNMLLGDVY